VQFLAFLQASGLLPPALLTLFLPQLRQEAKIATVNADFLQHRHDSCQRWGLFYRSDNNTRIISNRNGLCIPIIKINQRSLVLDSKNHQDGTVTLPV
jgi:hypothetical protein